MVSVQVKRSLFFVLFLFLCVCFFFCVFEGPLAPVPSRRGPDEKIGGGSGAAFSAAPFFLPGATKGPGPGKGAAGAPGPPGLKGEESPSRPSAADAPSPLEHCHVQMS